MDAPDQTIKAGETSSLVFSLPPLGHVSGVVHAPDGVTPSYNARVEARSGAWYRRTYTDASGNYTLYDLPEGDYGLTAYELWADLYEKWALLAAAGRNETLAPQVPECAGYYARINGGARCYARDWLEQIAGSESHLTRAAGIYARIADCLRPLWEIFPAEHDPDPDLLQELAAKIREAGRLEEQGIGLIRAHLAS